jgi:VanZ family protein
VDVKPQAAVPDGSVIRGLLTGWNLPVFIVTGIVLYSLMPFPQPDLPKNLNHLPHTVGYFVLMLAILHSATQSGGPGLARVARCLGLGVALIAFGGLMELAQGVVGRDEQWADFTADIQGVVAALLVWALIAGLRSAWRGARRSAVISTR